MAVDMMSESSNRSPLLDSTQPRRDRLVAVGIFFLVFAVYVLTYVGAFKSNDERALFSGTDSFVKRGEFTVNQIYWDYTNVGMLTSKGDMVPNYEPAQMVAAIPFYLWGRALGAAVQGTLFFNPLVTALAVALLYLCFVELGYRRRTATLGGLVFAFATLAWPYSRTFFREPLTMLAYVLAVYGAAPLSTGSSWAVRSAPMPRLLRGATAGWLWPAFPSGWPLSPSRQAWRWRLPCSCSCSPTNGDARSTLVTAAGCSVWLRIALAFLVPLGLMLALGRVYQAVTLGGVEVFARNIVEYTTNPQLSQSVPARMMRALLGISISPYKGLFWYCPVLLLGLAGALPFTRRFRWEGISFLLLIAFHLLGYSRYNYWSAGVAWGMRYLLPIVPFLVLLAAPVFEFGLFGNKSQIRTATSRIVLLVTSALIALSVAIQVVGMAVDLRTYEVRFLLEQSKVWGGIGQAIEALYLSPYYSPVLGHLRLLLAGTEPLDFAWVQLRQMGASAFVPAGLLLSLVLLGLAS